MSEIEAVEYGLRVAVDMDDALDDLTKAKPEIDKVSQSLDDLSSVSKVAGKSIDKASDDIASATKKATDALGRQSQTFATLSGAVQNYTSRLRSSLEVLELQRKSVNAGEEELKTLAAIKLSGVDIESKLGKEALELARAYDGQVKTIRDLEQAEADLRAEKERYAAVTSGYADDLKREAEALHLQIEHYGKGAAEIKAYIHAQQYGINLSSKQGAVILESARALDVATSALREKALVEAAEQRRLHELESATAGYVSGLQDQASALKIQAEHYGDGAAAIAAYQHIQKESIDAESEHGRAILEKARLVDEANDALSKLARAENEEKQRLKELEAATTGYAKELDRASIALRIEREHMQEGIKTKQALTHLATKGIDVNSKEAETILKKARAYDQADRELDQYRKSLVKTETTMDKVGKGIKSLKRHLGAFVVGIAAAIGIMATLRVANEQLIQQPLEAAASFQKMEATLSSAWRSAEGGRQAFDWILNKNLPFGIEAVTDAFVTLKGFGMDPMNGSFEAIAAQAAALGGDMQKLDSIGRAVGQMWGKQKIQAEEMNQQLVEAGVPAWQLLAEAMKKTVPEVQKLSEQGKLGREELVLLLGQMRANNSDALANYLNTYNGQLVIFKNNITSLRAALADAGILQAFQALLSSINESMQELIGDPDEVTRWGETIGRAVIDTAGAFDLLLSYSEPTTAMLRAIKAGAESVFNAATSIVASLGSFLVKPLEELLEFINGSIEMVLGLGGKIASALGLDGLSKSLTEMSNKFERTRDMIDGTAASMQDLAQEKMLAADSAAQDLGDALADLGDSWGESGKQSETYSRALDKYNELMKASKKETEGANAAAAAQAPVLSAAAQARKEWIEKQKEGLDVMQAELAFTEILGEEFAENEHLKKAYLYLVQEGIDMASKEAAVIVRTANAMDKLAKSIKGVSAARDLEGAALQEIRAMQTEIFLATTGMDAGLDNLLVTFASLQETAPELFNQLIDTFYELERVSKETAQEFKTDWDSVTESLKGDFVAAFDAIVFNGENAVDYLVDYLISSFAAAALEIAALQLFGGEQQQLGGLAGVFQSYLERMGQQQAASAAANAGANAATSAGAGAAGTAGYSAATGGSAAAGGGSAALGTVATYAAIAAVVAYVIDGVSGGKLFGTSYEEVRRDYSFDFSDGELTGVLDLLRTRERALFGGEKHDRVTELLDVSGIQARLDSVMSIVRNSAEQLGIESADELLSGFSAQFDLSLAGRSQEEIQRFLEQAITQLESDIITSVFPHIRFAVDAGETTLQALQNLATTSALITPDLDRRGINIDDLITNDIFAAVEERLRYILAIAEAGVTQGVGQIPYIEHHVPEGGFDPETGGYSGPDIPYFPDDLYDPDTGQIDPVAWENWRNSLGNYAEIVDEIAADMVIDEGELLEAARVAYLNALENAFGGVEAMQSAITAYQATFVATTDNFEAVLSAQMTSSQSQLDQMFNALGTNRTDFLADFQRALDSGNLDPDQLAAWYQAAEVLAQIMGYERDLAAVRGEALDINSLTVDQLENLMDRTQSFNEALESFGFKLALTGQQILDAEAVFGNIGNLQEQLGQFFTAFAPDRQSALADAANQATLAQFGFTPEDLAEGGRDVIVQLVQDLLAAGNFEELERVLSQLVPAADALLSSYEEEDRIRQQLLDTTDAINARLTVMGLNLMLSADQVQTFADTLGGLAEVSAQFDQFYSEFYSREEQLMLQREAAILELERLGLDVDEILVAGRGGFRQLLIEAVNNGDAMAAVYLDAVDEVDTLFDSVEALADAAAAAQREIEKLVDQISDVQAGVTDNIRLITANGLDGIDPFAELQYQIDRIGRLAGSEGASTEELIGYNEQLSDLITQRYEMEREQIIATAQQMVDAENAARREQYDAAMELYNVELARYRELQRLAENLRGFTRDLQLDSSSGLAPLARLEELQAQFGHEISDVLNNGGDGAALQSVAADLLRLAQQIYGNTDPYLVIRDSILSELDRVIGFADAQPEPEKPELVLLAGIRDSVEASAYATSALGAAQERNIAELEAVYEELENLRDQLEAQQQEAAAAEAAFRADLLTAAATTAETTTQAVDAAEQGLALDRLSLSLAYTQVSHLSQIMSRVDQIIDAVNNDDDGEIADEIIDGMAPMVAAIVSVETAVRQGSDRIVNAIVTSSTERSQDSDGSQGDRTTTTTTTTRPGRGGGGTRRTGSILDQEATA